MRTINRWAIVIGVLLFAAVVGFAAFQAGTAHGVEMSGTAPGGPAVPHPYPHYGWHGPWGFGLVVFPLLFFAFWFLVLRGLFWRAAWHPRWRSGWRCGCYGPHGRWGEHEAEGPAPGGTEES